MDNEGQRPEICTYAESALHEVREEPEPRMAVLSAELMPASERLQAERSERSRLIPPDPSGRETIPAKRGFCGGNEKEVSSHKEWIKPLAPAIQTSIYPWPFSICFEWWQWDDRHVPNQLRRQSDGFGSG